MKKSTSVLLLSLALSAAGAWAQEAALPAADTTGDSTAAAPAPAQEAAQAAAPAPAPETPVKAPLPCDVYPNALGFITNSDILLVSGFNLHYQRWFKNFGVSVSAGGNKSADTASGWGADALVELQYKLSDGNFDSDGVFYGALYAFLESGYVAQQTVTATYDAASGTTSYASAFSQYIPVGVGIGLEAVLFKHISVPLEVGFVYRFLADMIIPSAQIGIRYRF